jgi:hypothetical protein
MARLHIREQAGNNLYSVIVHSPAPVGNNSTGTAWASVIQAADAPVTQMTVGNRGQRGGGWDGSRNRVSVGR